MYQVCIIHGILGRLNLEGLMFPCCAPSGFEETSISFARTKTLTVTIKEAIIPYCKYGEVIDILRNILV